MDNISDINEESYTSRQVFETARFQKRLLEGMDCPKPDFSSPEKVRPPNEFSEQQKMYWFDLLDIFLEAGVITTADLMAHNLLVIGYSAIMSSTQSQSISISKMGTVFGMFAKFGCVPSERRVKGRQTSSTQLDLLTAELFPEKKF